MAFKTSSLLHMINETVADDSTFVLWYMRTV